jgi:hypothetical protein
LNKTRSSVVRLVVNGLAYAEFLLEALEEEERGALLEMLLEMTGGSEATLRGIP